jgi:preprotein translocase SecE subunit
MNSILTYFKEVQREIKQTTFPTKDFTFYYTLFVIVFAVVMALYFALLDLGFGKALFYYLQTFVK